jgi:hypothetical protein
MAGPEWTEERRARMAELRRAAYVRATPEQRALHRQHQAEAARCYHATLTPRAAPSADPAGHGRGRASGRRPVHGPQQTASR